VRELDLSIAKALGYEAKDGTKRYITEIVASEVQFLDRAKDAEQQPFVEINQPDDLPF
jgi:single-stranded DNA-binding protein